MLIGKGARCITDLQFSTEHITVAEISFHMLADKKTRLQLAFTSPRFLVDGSAPYTSQMSELIDVVKNMLKSLDPKCQIHDGKLEATNGQNW